MSLKSLEKRIDVLEEREALFADFANKMTTAYKELNTRLDNFGQVAIADATLSGSTYDLIKELDDDFDDKVIAVYVKWHFGQMELIHALQAESLRVAEVQRYVAGLFCEFADAYSGDAKLPLPMATYIKDRLAFILKDEKPPKERPSLKGGIPLAT